MKRLLIGLLLWALLGACEEKTKETATAAIPEFDGRWNFTLMPSNLARDSYTVEVTKAGGPFPNLAEISVSSEQGDTATAIPVWPNFPTLIGDCGLLILFSDTASQPLALSLGDQWSFLVSAGRIFNPTPAPGNSSTVVSVETGGIYLCLPGPCAGGLLGAMVPSVFGVGLPGPAGLGQQGELPLIPLNQTDSNLSSTFPEINVLTLNLPGTTVGDNLKLSYSRKVDVQNPQGDFFLVQAINGSRIEEAEFRQASQTPSFRGTRELTFEARSANLSVDFIFGLSGPGSVMQLDQVVVLRNGEAWFSDNFSDPSFINDLMPKGRRWEVRSPAVPVGSFGLSNLAPLQGAYSVRAEGGLAWSLQGAILTGAGTLGLGLGGGDPNQALQGVTLEVWPNQEFGFLTSLAALEQSAGVLAGTFRGEAADHGCLEQGEFLASRNQSGIAEVAGTWTLRIEGEAQECEGMVEFGDTLGPISVDQRGRAFFADPEVPIVDKYSNQNNLFGTVTGPAGLFTLGDFAVESDRAAVFLGTVSEDSITGNFIGTLPFADGKTCQVTGSFSVTLEKGTK